MVAHLVETYRGVTAEQAADDVARFVESLGPDFVLEAGDGA
jgi:hypothetical protein